MDKKRRKEEEQFLNKLYKNNNYELFKKNIDIVYRNNDFLKGLRCKGFEWVINNTKDRIETARNDFNKLVLKTYTFINIYFKMVEQTVDFIKRNIEDDSLHRYAFLQSLFMNNCFSDGVVDLSHEYIDLFFIMGLDVIFGNSCCRHKSNLLKDVLSKFENTLYVSVGKNENKTSDHAIISINNDNKIIFLDSIEPELYYFSKELKLMDDLGYQYIKSVPTYLYNDYFKNIDEYYDYFNSLYKKSYMSIYQYDNVYIEILRLFKMYNANKELQEGFMDTIKMDRLLLKLNYGSNQFNK